jgi:hypothetical protein
MADGSERLGKLRERREDLKRELAAVGEMRPGALVGRYRKCGKPSCHCAQMEAGGHGPSWSLTRVVAGKTVTKIIPAAAVDDTQAQIAEHRRFRDLTRELVDVSEQICDANLAAAPQAQAAKKGGSKRRLRAKSAPKSRRS